MHLEPIENYIVEDNDISDTPGPFQADCAFCRGTGVHPGTMKSITFSACPVCQGKGILKFAGSRSDYATCSQCNRSGRESGSQEIKPCPACGGYGIT
jgi:DnaJ-class molecular chaperone